MITNDEIRMKNPKIAAIIDRKSAESFTIWNSIDSIVCYYVFFFIFFFSSLFSFQYSIWLLLIDFSRFDFVVFFLLFRCCYCCFWCRLCQNHYFVYKVLLSIARSNPLIRDKKKTRQVRRKRKNAIKIEEIDWGWGEIIATQ